MQIKLKYRTQISGYQRGRGLWGWAKWVSHWEMLLRLVVIALKCKQIIKMLHTWNLCNNKKYAYKCKISIKYWQTEFSSVQLLSCVQVFATPWTAACQASLSISNSWSLLKLMSVKLVMPSNHLILCRPLLLLPLIFPQIRVFSNESVLLIRCPKYWSFSFSISPSNEYSGLISFRIDWFDLLAVQGTLRVFPNTTVQKHRFFSTQLSLWANSNIHI